MKSKSEILAKKARLLVTELVYNSNSSHIGSCLSIIDILAVLYSDILNIDNKFNKNRDRFVLSKGHACLALYVILYLKNFFKLKNLLTYGKNFSPFMSHASHLVKGVEFSSGSLGHGLPHILGRAIFAKRNSKKWKSFVLISDGELNEGSNWEAIMFASHLKLDNLIIIVDSNKLQSLSTVKETLNTLPLKRKFDSFGYDSVLVDGHNHSNLKKIFKNLDFNNKKPKVIIANTIKGKGISFMENKVEWHYKSPNKDQYQKAIKEIKNN